MSRIPPHIIDEIMQTARIEEVIGEFVQLKRAGSNLKGLSPFTDEKTPSFVVSPAKQIFKCFSTGKGGTAVTFLMEKEHYSYPEALRWLADKYNIAIPEDRPATKEELEAISEKESLFIINDFANKHFVNNLHNTDEGKKIGLSYFLERGFRPEIIEKFQLGYSINKGDDFTSAALDKGYKKEFLEKVGLTKTKDDRSFDFFRGRVMFPIHSISGRVLGFGGRTLFTDKKVAKYFNSPESPIYNKSEILYGLYYSKGDIIKYDRCFLCEGYTDVISMYQAGIHNVVSSSGTSLTKEQIRLVKRYTKNITILYDGDAAGIKASFRGIDLILEEGLNVEVVLFPEGEDPDSYSKAVSSSELEQYIEENTQDFISFKAGILLNDGDEDPIKRSELIKDIVHSVSLIPDSITRNVYVQSIAKQFGINEQILNAELIRLRKGVLSKEHGTNEFYDIPVKKEVVKPVEVKPKGTNERIEDVERDLIRILILYSKMEVTPPRHIAEFTEDHKDISVAEYIIHNLAEDEHTFNNPIYARIHNIIAEALGENSFLLPSHFLKMEDQEVVHFVSAIDLEDHEISKNWKDKYGIHTNTEKDKLYDAVTKAVMNFKLAKIELRLSEIIEAKQEDQDYESLIDLLAEEKELLDYRLTFNRMLGRD
ncbi:MAG: DNA primase [Crocinitomicaceae bacterium]